MTREILTELVQNSSSKVDAAKAELHDAVVALLHRIPDGNLLVRPSWDILEEFEKVCDKLSNTLKSLPRSVMSIDESSLAELRTHRRVGLSEDWTGSKPCGFVFRCQPNFVNDWKNVYQVLCFCLRDVNPTRFDELADSFEAKSTQDNPYLTRDRRNFNEPHEVTAGLGIFVEGKLSANAIRDRISVLLRRLNVDKSEVEFYLIN